MKIGILGSGKVGGALGTRWAQAGHQVTFGSRDPGADAIKQLVGNAGATASSATFADTARACEVLLLAAPWTATRSLLEGLGALDGKILIDATNALLPDLSGLQLDKTTSAGEKVAEWAPGAKVVKAFNTIGFTVMANATFGTDRALLLYCGDDAGAKQTVKQLAADIGFDPVDAGPLTKARVLESFALLWISLAFGGQGPQMAFKLLKR